MGATCCRPRCRNTDADLDDEDLGPYIQRAVCTPDRDFLARIASAVMSATTGLAHDNNRKVKEALTEQFFNTYRALYDPEDNDVETHYYLYAAAIVNHYDSDVPYVHRRAADTPDGYRKPFADARRRTNAV